MNGLTIGEALRHIREYKKITQQQLAATLNIDRTVVSKNEANIKGHTFSSLYKHAYALGCEVHIIITDKKTGLKKEIKLEP